MSVGELSAACLSSKFINMGDFSLVELADIHFFYGRANGNSLEARRLYEEAFPNRRIPYHSTFANVDRRLRETGRLTGNYSNCGRQYNARTPQAEEDVLNAVAFNPRASTRRIALAETLSQSTTWRILNDELLHPFHVQKVQGLLPADYHPRVNYCQWLLGKCAENPQFCSRVLFTDEAGFTRNGMFNYRNEHVWSHENPHAIVQFRHQHQFSVNVWAGIVGDCLVGPFVFPERLNGVIYRNFLENELPILLEDVPLNIRNHLWFMHDGAPPHFSRLARNYLDMQFGHRWIGRGGPVAWPPRSPDLNPLDFYLWGHLKTLVYSEPVNNAAELRERINNCCNIIRNTPGIFERVRQNARRRAETCIETNGGHFEHLL